MDLNKTNSTLIRFKIQSLNQLNSIDSIKVELQKVLKGCPFRTVRISERLSLYRAQIMDSSEFCVNISRMSYPPSHLIKSNGRVNRVNKPMLYLGQTGRTALFESKLSNNQFVAIAEYKLIPETTLNLQHVGFWSNKTHMPIKTSGTFSKKDLISFGLNSIGRKNLKTLNKILGDTYLTKVEQGDESKYNLSIALAEHFLSYENADGITYPSTLSKHDINIALKPESCNKVRIHNVLGLKTVETSNKEIIFKHIASSKSITSDGIIDWQTKGSIKTPKWAENITYHKNA